MLLPELILQDLVQKLQKITNDDWLDVNVKPKYKLLTRLFDKDDNDVLLKVDNFNYLEGAKSIFLFDEESPRQLQVNFGYNRERMGMPTIHILLPQENASNNSLGLDEDYEFDEDDEEETNPTEGHVVKDYTFQATYNFMLTSDNTNEVLIIYYWLRNMLLAASDHLELKGLQNVKFGGQDLSLSQELVNPNVFHRNLQLSFQYENRIVTNIVDQVRKGLQVLKPTT